MLTTCHTQVHVTRSISHRVLPVTSHYTTTTIPQPFYSSFSGTTRVSRCQKRTSGVYGAILDFMVQGKINRGRHTNHPTGRHSNLTNQCPPPPSPFFYRPDALPATQPTVTKHWRQLTSHYTFTSKLFYSLCRFILVKYTIKPLHFSYRPYTHRNYYLPPQF